MIVRRLLNRLLEWAAVAACRRCERGPDGSLWLCLEHRKSGHGSGSYYEDGQWRSGTAIFRWECACGAQSRRGDFNKAQMEDLAMRHRLNNYGHEPCVTKELK